MWFQLKILLIKEGQCISYKSASFRLIGVHGLLTDDFTGRHEHLPGAFQPRYNIGGQSCCVFLETSPIQYHPAPVPCWMMTTDGQSRPRLSLLDIVWLWWLRGEKLGFTWHCRRTHGSPGLCHLKELLYVLPSWVQPRQEEKRPGVSVLPLSLEQKCVCRVSQG